jgi:hypothetical protein
MHAVNNFFIPKNKTHHYTIVTQYAITA